MALKTNYKDDGFTGNRKYRQITNADNTLSFEDVTAYNPVGDNFGAKDINDTNTAVNSITNPTFEDYTSTAVPDPETALSGIKSKASITTLFTNIKAVLKGAFLKMYLLTTKEQLMANTLAGRTADALLTKQLNQDLAKGQIQFDIQNGKGFYKAVGADTWTPFKTGVTLLGRYSAVSTYDLSNVPGYESLNVDDFLCVTNTGNTNGSKYENDSNGTIQLSIGYTAAQLSYNASTGILTITPALLSGSAFHNPATATASGYLSTSVYLIQ